MTDAPLQIDVSGEEGRRVVTPSGELDLATVPELERTLTDALSAGAAVLRLSEVSFIDSSGLNLLVTVSRTARGQGWTLELREPSPAVERLISLTGVQELLGSPGE